MKKSKFTPEELDLIAYFATERSASSNLGFYFAVLFTPLAFAVYGLFNDEIVAMSLALLGLLIFIAWFLFGSITHAKILKNISEKILTSEQTDSSE